MKPLNEIYGDRFFARRYKLNWRAPIIAKAIYRTFQPDSVIDVGCATGDIIRELLCMGVKAYGIEGSEACYKYLEVLPERVILRDLRKKFCWIGKVSLCLCLEVAEHIEEEYADVFIDNLCGLSNKLLLSIAGVGQGGHYHVNLKTISYWHEKFIEKEYFPDDKPVEKLKATFEPYKLKDGIRAYYNNMVYYEKA